YIEHLVPVIRGKGATSKEVQALIPAQYQETTGKKGAKSRSGIQNEHVELPIFAAGDGSVSRVRSTWQLTSAERKRILLNNIFGVDIDTQAVEVTKLSLLLKVLEDENEETISKQLKLFAERALPSLHKNIKCGNSLIGPDIYIDIRTTLTDDEIRQINPFDWRREFPEIMLKGGFDAVIGNPPYVRQETLGQVFKDYVRKQYAVYAGTADLYAYFIEKGVSLLGEGGRFSYIVANKWMRANYGKPLRLWLKTKHIEEIVDFGDLPVFQNATTYPCIITVLEGTANPTFHTTQVQSLDFPNLAAYVEENQYPVNQDELDANGWSLADGGVQGLLNRLKEMGIPLGEYVQGKIFYGIKTGLNKAFVIDAETRERLVAEDPKSEVIIKPFLAGRDVKRYQPLHSDTFLIFTRRGIDIRQYPAIERHLKQLKTELTPRPADWKGDKWSGRKPGSYKWYELQDSIDYYKEFEKPKVIIPAIVRSASYAFDKEGFYSNDKTSIIPTNDLYLLGILNSKVSDVFIYNISSTKQGGYYEYKPMYVSQIPIHPIDPTNPDDIARHDRIVSLVGRILDLNTKVGGVREAHARELLVRQIEAIDAEIDKEVYELYGLTEEEIRIVEEAVAQ
ncbi:TaqI-like C-terminal specificity domain-containing protein, partial [Methanocalculus sp.]|uniref:Eco57I restriction-modification methylase domain-containing protein n=1 Tax=Methanocalculus sp. TaxID=2004547 RepID=UPI002723042E